MVLSERPENYRAWDYNNPYLKRYNLTNTFKEGKDFDARVLKRHEMRKADKVVNKVPKWIGHFDH